MDHDLIVRARQFLNRERNGRLGDIDDDVGAVVVKPVARNGGADIGLGLVVARDDFDRPAQHLAAEILDRHLRRKQRARTHDIAIHAGHVG